MGTKKSVLAETDCCGHLYVLDAAVSTASPRVVRWSPAAAILAATTRAFWAVVLFCLSVELL